jgi:hypothetical protein
MAGAEGVGVVGVLLAAVGVAWVLTVLLGLPAGPTGVEPPVVTTGGPVITGVTWIWPSENSEAGGGLEAPGVGTLVTEAHCVVCP